MRKILSILLENEPGALSRVIGLFSQRGYNIESLTVSPTEDITLSKITLQTYSNPQKINQIKKQLRKIIDVFQVTELKEKKYIEKEILLIKLIVQSSCEKNVIKKIMKKKLNITILSKNSKFLILQIIGKNNHINDLIKESMKNIKISEISRSGIASITKI